MVGILKYGVGNIFSLLNIFEEKNIPCKFILSENDFIDVTHVILPGVGAFDFALEMFEKSGLKSHLIKLVNKEKIFLLGICVGFQMLFKFSEEGKKEGLNLLDLQIKKFNPDNNVLIPHMGWNNVNYDKALGNSLFANISQGSKFYFLHSFYLPETNELKNLQKAKTHYGQDFVSMVVKNNIIGAQFHPEKSHDQGIKFLINFYNLR
tara:strand:- start:151 stop:771 length:621 start_codon:yes stop_codon:yes gene_type:complete